MFKKIIKKILIALAFIIPIVLLLIFVQGKEVIDVNIKTISIDCGDGVVKKLKDEERLEFERYLEEVADMEDRNLNIWDLTKKYTIIINDKERLRITDYNGSSYYGNYNKRDVSISKDLYKKVKEICSSK